MGTFALELSPLHLVASGIAGLFMGFFAWRNNRHPVAWFFIGALLGLLWAFLLFFFWYRFKGATKPTASAVVVAESVRVPTVEAALPPFFDRKEWYYLNDAHQQQGPFDFSILRDSWKGGAIAEKTYVWCVGMDEWKSVRDLPQLRSCLEQ